MHFDPISLLESAYLPRNSQIEWLGALTKEVVLALDPEAFAAVGYIVGPRGPEETACVQLTDHLDAVASRFAMEKAVELFVQQGTVGRFCNMQTPGLHSFAADMGCTPADRWRELPVQVADSLSLSVLGSDGRTLQLSSLSPTKRTIESWERTFWHAMSVHMSASVRLVGGLSSPHLEDSCMRSLPQVFEGMGSSLGSDAELLRRATLDMDRMRTREGRSDPHQALSLWQGLLAGRWALVEHFDTDGKRFLLARQNDSATKLRLSPRQRQALFLAALGFSNQEVSYALGISESTVATHISTGLSKLALKSRGELIRLQSTLIGGFKGFAWEEEPVRGAS